MRTIPVSTAVYSAIWSARQPGEEDENQILSRILSVQSEIDDSKSPPSASHKSGGVYEVYGRVTFPEGFEIFRSFSRGEKRGQKFHAIAQDGRWFVKELNKSFKSVNEISKALSITENVWANWCFKRNEATYLLDRFRKESHGKL